MRAIFIGCVESSYRMLTALINSDAVEIVGIVTKISSTFNADFCSLTGLAVTHNIQYLIDDGNNQAALYSWLREMKPDVIFCVGWPYLLKDNILSVPGHGVIGYHPTDLPHNRGRHPIIWALALGLEKTASTFFVMVKEADAGPIVDKVEIQIFPDYDARELYDRLMEVAELQIVRIAQRLTLGTLNHECQNDTNSNVWRKRSKRDGLVDLRMSSKTIHNLVRALAKPYVGAHCVYLGNEFKIWRVQQIACDERHLEPGKILAVHGTTFVVKTGDGAILIIDHDLSQIPACGDYL